MTKDEIIEIANQASREWIKEFPTPEETANKVPKRFLEIFANLVVKKERQWVGVTDSNKVFLIRSAFENSWTKLTLIEEVEQMLRHKNDR